MNEKIIVQTIVEYLKLKGYKVATEVANLHRSADIAAIDKNGNVVIIECKVSNIRKAIEQIKTHMNSADRVYIGIPSRNNWKKTLSTFNELGIGLIHVNNDGSIDMISESKENIPWHITRNKIKERILDYAL